MLNIRDAFNLYYLLEQHIPDEVDDDVLGFIGKILESMIEKGVHGNYSNAIMLMNNNITLQDLQEMQPEETVEMFLSGLADNKILKLHRFMQGLR